MTATDWDAQAATLDDARRAVWAEDDQAAGVEHCLAMLAPLLDHLDPDSVVLDLGAGIGRLAIPIAQTYPTVIIWGLDASQTMLTHLLDRCIHDDIRNVLVIPCDGCTIPDQVLPLDGAYSVVTLQHLPAAQQASYVDQLVDRLRPGGVLRIQVVTDTEPGPLSHPVTMNEIIDWFDDRVTTVDIDPDPRYPTWRWITAIRR